MKLIRQQYKNGSNFELEWENGIKLWCHNHEFLMRYENKHDVLSLLNKENINYKEMVNCVYIYFDNVNELDTVLKYLGLEMR
jgi:hypothetical protein